MTLATRHRRVSAQSMGIESDRHVVVDFSEPKSAGTSEGWGYAAVSLPHLGILAGQPKREQIARNEVQRRQREKRIRYSDASDRRRALSVERQMQLLSLYGDGADTVDLASRFGVTVNYIQKLASRFGVRKGQGFVADCNSSRPPVINALKGHVDRLDRYHQARRGFHLPARLADAYVALLKRGVPIAEAAAELGLVRS